MLDRRQLLLAGSAGILSTILSNTILSHFAFAAAGPADVPGPYIDPELRAALQAFQQMMSRAQNAGANANPADRQRALANAAAAPTGWVERTVPGPKDAPDVRVFVLNGGKGDAPRPAILHMHGGGYVGGSPRLSMPQLVPLGATLDCVIVSVDYRLAPGTKFPGSLEDNYAGLKWLYRNADRIVAPGRTS